MCVTTSTSQHAAGNQLNILVCRSDSPVLVVRVDDPPMMSDHSLVVASFELIDRCIVEKSIAKRRRWRSFDYAALTGDL